MTTVRPPAVAGAFYPADPDELTGTVRRLLTAASPPEVDVDPKILIVPHAGYVYSGPVAATAYRLLEDEETRDRFDRVALVGPSHFVRFVGVATPAVDALDTPLGRIPTDSELTSAAHGFDVTVAYPEAHAREHSLEVQLPFLQVVLDGFSLLALATGDVAPEAAAGVLDQAVSVPGVLGVVSSDLSHYLDHRSARRRDAATADAITRLRPYDLTWDDACGRTAVQAALLVASWRGWRCRLLDLRTSGDTAGPRDRVVGYGAFVLGPPR